VNFYDDENESTEAAEVADQVEQTLVSPSRDSGLHICPGCGSGLVYPVRWEERAGGRWQIERRCPDCEWHDDAAFDHEVVEAFDDVLNQGREALLAGFRTLSRANMADDVERFIQAIQEDQILPMDF
jgi:hypothetical protein